MITSQTGPGPSPGAALAFQWYQFRPGWPSCVFFADGPESLLANALAALDRFCPDWGRGAVRLKAQRLERLPMGAERLIWDVVSESWPSKEQAADRLRQGAAGIWRLACSWLIGQSAREAPGRG